MTIVGEPGVGKSRLCAELFGYIEERPGLVRWRQGRCLPYGEGIAFWALGEIVKAECGILESDSPEEAAAKLERALPADDPDRAWLQGAAGAARGCARRSRPRRRSRSRPGGASCESLAAEAADGARVRGPALGRRGAARPSSSTWPTGREGVPLLLLCTARPELYEQHPTWAAGLRNATTINLAPLTDEETARLIASLLERAVLPAETQQALLERAGGNPLYAEEFVRLLADRGRARARLVEVPDSVQALIAARLDTLSPERKSLLQDAAVVGKVFWAGALAEMGGRDPREVEQALHELARKELVRPARTSLDGRARPSTASGTCWSGTSATRRSRAPPAPPATARPPPGSSGKAGERAEDLADVLAHHYLTALELARAAGQAERGGGAGGERDPLPGPGRRAGARARRRRAPRQSLARALALAPAGHPERAVAARALGAGGAAAGPAPGGTGGARGGARPLPRAGRDASPPGGC